MLGEGAHIGYGGDKCADGHAAAHAFSDEQNVGCDAVFLEGEECACAAKTSLDLVKNEEGSGLGAAIAELLKVVAEWWSDTPLCLDGLDNNASSALRDLVEAVGTIVLDVADLWEQRSKRCSKSIVAHEADRALRTTVVCLFAGNYFSTTRDALCELHRAFGSFGSTVD